MGQRMQTEIFIIFVSFAYFLLQSKNGYSSKVLVKNVSLYVYLKSFWSKICKYFCKMVMRIAKNCQNFRYPQNCHFEFFFKIFFGNFFSVIYIVNQILMNFLYDNFHNFPVMLIYIYCAMAIFATNFRQSKDKFFKYNIIGFVFDCLS